MGAWLQRIEGGVFIRAIGDARNGFADVVTRDEPEKQIRRLRPVRDLIGEREPFYDTASRQNRAGRQYRVGADPTSIADQ